MQRVERRVIRLERGVSDVAASIQLQCLQVGAALQHRTNYRVGDLGAFRQIQAALHIQYNQSVTEQQPGNAATANAPVLGSGRVSGAGSSYGLSNSLRG